MIRARSALIGLFVLAATASHGLAQSWTREQELAAAVLPLPDSMRVGAGVRVMLAAGPTILRESKNGMMCTVVAPGGEQFDARCYRVEFLAFADYARALLSTGTSESEIDAKLKADAAARRVVIPDHPTAGYRMLGPTSAFDRRMNVAGAAIERWQSMHMPFRTAEEMGLPTDRDGMMPFVMESGRWWSHVMIVHATSRLP